MGEPWDFTEEEGKQKESALIDKIDEELLKKRVVLLNGELKEYVVDKVCRLLLYLEVQETKEPIQVILNSIGGEVYLGLLLFNTLRDIAKKGIPVHIEVRGLAASMGAVILQAGTKRRASKYTRFMIHEITTYSWGKSSDVKEQAEEAIRLNNLLRTILAEGSKKSPEEIEKIWHKTDVYMSAEEALDFGLIDEIV